jgi:hypothetical protein
MHPHLVRAVAAALLVAPAVGAAQLVTPRTVPVFQHQQFDLLPSSLAGMGGVSIALDDSLADAFSNPARAGRLREGKFFAAPFRHGISGDRGGGRTLPLGGAGSVGAWSFAGAVALQQIDRAGPMRFAQVNSDRTATNQYVMMSAARRLGRGVTIGASASFAGLDAVDGVDLLYGGSDRIEQAGSSADLRIGLSRDLGGGRTFDLVLLRNSYEMTHDVRFVGPAVFDSSLRLWAPVTRSEHNEDRTNIWGAHAEYSQPIGTNGWRIGWLGTINTLSHPKIPNYVLQNIPRDPGSTVAMNAGIGLARTVGGTTFGADLIIEPMWANTWADLAHDTTVVGGGVIKAGGKTVENDFRFTNSLIRVGIGHDFVTNATEGSTFGFELGLGVYSIDYRLQQQNNVLKTSRRLLENWMEWTPTFGLAYKAKSMTLRYAYATSCAGDNCFSLGDRVELISPTAGGDFATGIIAAPSSALTFNGGHASSHKVWVAVPIR